MNHLLLETFGNPNFTYPVFLSFRILIFIVPLLVLFCIPLGIYLGGATGWKAGIVDFVVSLPMVFPPIATGFMLLVVLGKQSLIGSFLDSILDIRLVFSFFGVVLAGFISGFPLMVKTIQATVRNEVQNYIEVSYMLGKTRRTTFFRITIPLLRKGIINGLFLAIARALGDVGITLMVGGNIIGRTNTISLEVYNSVFLGDFKQASIMAVFLGLITLGITGIIRLTAKE